MIFSLFYVNFQYKLLSEFENVSSRVYSSNGLFNIGDNL